jgi:hypothetical protein
MHPMKRWLLATAASTGLLGAPPAMATVFVNINDVSQLKYQTFSDGRVYIRNFNIFNASALGYCYNYWFDTNTVEGKNIMALLLSYSAQRRGLYFGVPDGFAAGLVNNVGEF